MVIFIIWTQVYLSIDHRRDSLTEKVRKLEIIENRFLDNKSQLDAFLLLGYRNPQFYVDAGEPHINKFLSTQLQLQNSLRKLKFEFADENLYIESEIDSIFVLNTRFIRSIEYLKTLMYERGYLHSGLEGELKDLGRQLEVTRGIPSSEIAKLRNLEKEFLRTGQDSTVEEFNEIALALLSGKYLSSANRAAIAEYQEAFRAFASLDNKIGINTNSGAYAQVQDEMVELRSFYEFMVDEIKVRSESLYLTYRRQLWLVSLVMIVILLIVSVYLSGDLTNDVRVLSKKVYSFIQSDFRSTRFGDFKPRNTEIINLNRSFDEMIARLQITLHRMEEEKKRAEKSAEYKSLFLANMSHEIRTPLNGVIGMLHMLRGTRLSQKQRQYMEVVEYSANHLLDLVNMILDHSKLNARKMQLEEIEFDLAGDMNKLVKIFEFKTREKGLEISLVADGNFDHKLIGDSLRLQQVLMNLLNNAVKFTEEGKITLHINELERSKERQLVKFVVEDSGIGISKANQDRLFHAFEQLDGSTTRQYGGTGLGLAISNQLVQMMGGSIDLESEEGKGAKFCFDVEFKIGSKLESKPNLKEGNQQETSTISAIRVLLAEDNPVNQKVITLMLEQAGAQVEIANNGLEAVDIFKEKEFDLVLMDLQMPEMDGLEASKVIKASRKYKKHPTPIIAVTANAFVEDRTRALEAGMDDFLTKPIRPQEFKGILAKYSPNLITD
jgi:signal transduction histidine kinase/ActR/RegA family two-component response regulator